MLTATIGTGTPRQNSHRVLRGGNWINNARNLRCANRNANSPDDRNHNIGFRLAGALLQNAKIVSLTGSINQWCLLLLACYQALQQNQDQQRVSKWHYFDAAESLLSGRLILSRGRLAAYLIPSLSLYSILCWFGQVLCLSTPGAI